MSQTPHLKLYNTLTRKKEVFEPIDADNVRMYVCGPTVYDFAHIGNARPVIVFDVLYRLLRHLYGKDHVTYVRNITDVDDKINARALRDFPDLPLNDAIAKVTEKTANQFHADVKALGCLEPDHQPRATQHIEGMVKMIQTLIDKGHAYQAGGEVLFDVSSMPDYGKLSNRKLEDQRAGARIATTDHKKNPGDFVLWKLSTDNQPGWKSPWGVGRPGWHIECSVMSEHHLGKTFDIHGGGLDLIFPHHENEIAQSCCAHGNDKMANVWMHNGFLQVEGKKMSKSDGNFVTISDLIGKVWPGEVIRFNMLKTHYRQPIDWTEKELDQSFDQYFSLIETASRYPNNSHSMELVLNALNDDLNTSQAISELLKLQKSAESGSIKAGEELHNSMQLLGFSDLEMRGGIVFPKLRTLETEEFDLDFGVSPIQLLKEVFKLFPRNYPLGKMLDALQTINSKELEITNEISTICNMLVGISKRTRIGDLTSVIDNLDNITGFISNRLTHIANKDWPAADTIRDELLTQGIQLKDGKDPDTGERVTTWEVKR